MDVNLKREAQVRADRIAAFRAELTELEREQGLTLTPEQRSHLEAHLEGVLATLARQFGADVTDSAKRTVHPWVVGSFSSKGKDRRGS
jgi:hypothetical protein